MSFKNACVCDANADQKLSRYCRDHITRRNILATTNKIVASADRPLVAGNVLMFTLLPSIPRLYNDVIICLTISKNYHN